MKQLILSCVLLVSFSSARAQTSQDEYYGESTKDKAVTYKAPMEDNEYANTEMSVSNKMITLTDLPVLAKPTWAIITNGSGEQIKQMRVGKDKNTIDVRHLQSGMYFVTLVYKNKSKKAFVLQLDQ